MKIGKLIAQSDEMLDRSKSIDANDYQEQAMALRRDVLDEFTRRSLSDHRFNRLYSEIENNVRFRFVYRLDEEKSQVEALVRSYYEPGLRFLKDRLELAAAKFAGTRRPNLRHDIRKAVLARIKAKLLRDKMYKIGVVCARMDLDARQPILPSWKRAGASDWRSAYANPRLKNAVKKYISSILPLIGRSVTITGVTQPRPSFHG